MGDSISRIVKSATVDVFKGWKNPKKLFSRGGAGSLLNSPLIDPGGLIFTPKEKQPRPPTDEKAVADSAMARENERRRLASSGSQTTYSGRRSDALSASIGKRNLGGSA